MRIGRTAANPPGTAVRPWPPTRLRWLALGVPLLVIAGGSAGSVLDRGSLALTGAFILGWSQLVGL